MIDVRLSKQAVEDLDRLPENIGRRIYTALIGLSENPRPPGCKKIQGREDTYRIRIGDYRALYDIKDASQAILVLRVQHRKDAYRNI